MSDEIVCKVAGHGETPIFKINVRRLMCGHITDGVGLSHGESPYGYVLAFADLEAAYLAAKKFREENPLTHYEKEFAGFLERAMGADPFCKCGHRRSDHEELPVKYCPWRECNEPDCDCEFYERSKAGQGEGQ